MIRVVDGLPEGVLGFRASGKLTAQDYTDVLAPALAAASAGDGSIRVLLDFTGEFDGMERGHGRDAKACAGLKAGLVR